MNIGLGGRAFIIDEDAYSRLSLYLQNFRSKLDVTQCNEVMYDLEARLAELFAAELPYAGQVISIQLVERIIAQVGMPDGSSEQENPQGNPAAATEPAPVKGPKKFFRDSENRRIGGVCGGLGHYLGIDITLLRIIALVCLLFLGVGFWIYIILWIVAPKAVTPAEKCEMYGWPVTAENMAKFYRAS